MSKTSARKLFGFESLFAPFIQGLVTDRVKLGVAACAANICRELTLLALGHPHEGTVGWFGLDDADVGWDAVTTSQVGFADNFVRGAFGACSIFHVGSPF